MRFAPLFLLVLFLLISSGSALPARLISGVWKTTSKDWKSQLNLVLMPSNQGEAPRMGVEYSNSAHYPGSSGSCKFLGLGDFESTGPDSGIFRSSIPAGAGPATMTINFDPKNVAITCDNCMQLCAGKSGINENLLRSQMASIPPSIVRDIVSRINAAVATASPTAQRFGGEFSGVMTYQNAVKVSIVPTNVAWAKVSMSGVSADQSARCELHGDAMIDDKTGTLVLAPKSTTDECRIVITRMDNNKLLLQDQSSKCASSVCKGASLNFNDPWAKFKSMFTGVITRNPGTMASEAELDSAELDAAELDSAELDSSEYDASELDSADSIDTSANRIKRTSVKVIVDLN